MSLEIEKKKLERKKVLLNADEKRFKILERLEDIERMKADIKIQEERAEELSKEIEKLEKGE